MLVAAGFAAGFHGAHWRNLSSHLSRLKYRHCEATQTLKTSAVILEHAGGEGRFRRSGITETFGITIKRKTDVDAAANWKVEEKTHRRVRKKTTQSSSSGKICILSSSPCSLSFLRNIHIESILYTKWNPQSLKKKNLKFSPFQAFAVSFLGLLFNLLMQFWPCGAYVHCIWC